MSAPPELLDLVARFKLHLDAYKAGQYNETQLRRDFLDPFFNALGWDVDNLASYAEAYRDGVDDKPEVKKAGGVYYPTYIVDCIVRQTVGKLVEEILHPVGRDSVEPSNEHREASEVSVSGDARSARADFAGKQGSTESRPTLDPRRATAILNRVAKLRVLDPACGSGSFLIGAYLRRADCCWASPALDGRCTFKYRLPSRTRPRSSRFMNLIPTNGSNIGKGGRYV